MYFFFFNAGGEPGNISLVHLTSLFRKLLLSRLHSFSNLTKGHLYVLEILPGLKESREFMEERCVCRGGFFLMGGNYLPSSSALPQLVI